MIHTVLIDDAITKGKVLIKEVLSHKDVVRVTNMKNNYHKAILTDRIVESDTVKFRTFDEFRYVLDLELQKHYGQKI